MEKLEKKTGIKKSRRKIAKSNENQCFWNMKTTMKTNGTQKTVLWKKINKIDKPVAWLRKEKMYITNVRNQRSTLFWYHRL